MLIIKKVNNWLFTNYVSIKPLLRKLQMAHKHMKKSSTLVATRKMQVKTTMRYHLTSAKMAIINKSTNNKCLRGCGEKGTLVHCWLEFILVQPLWKTVWIFLKKLKMKLPFDPMISLLGICLKNPDTLIQKNICTPMFIAALLTIAKIWKEPKCLSVDE